MADRWVRWWDQWHRNGAALVNPPSLLDTDEVKAITGLADGPELGTALRALRRAQARGEVRTPNGARRFLTNLQTTNP
jgi:poly(A) polymerase